MTARLPGAVPARERSPRRARHLRSAGLVAAVLLGISAATVPGSRADFTVALRSSATTTTAEYFTCAAAITASGPWIYHRLDETSGSTAADSSGGGRDGAYHGTVIRGVAAPCVRDTGTAVRLDPSSGFVSSNTPTTTDPATGYTGEVWFRTTTGSGGLILGFGSLATGPSTSVDRVIYLSDSGRVLFGVNHFSRNTIASSRTGYNDGSWHHVMATAGPAGIRLHIDGVQVASATTTLDLSYTGYLRVGYDNLLLWPSAPTSSAFAGSLDEAAVYLKPLSATDAANHAAAGR